MSEREQAKSGEKVPASQKRDSEEALQQELKREAAETRGIGDVDDNRNLSGSSTWETLPENK